MGQALTSAGNTNWGDLCGRPSHPISWDEAEELRCEPLFVSHHSQPSYGSSTRPRQRAAESRRDTSEVSPTRMHRRKFQKTAARKKKEARESAARALQKTKARLGIGTVGLLKGAISSPLAAVTQRRTPKTAPTSDRIPGSALAEDLLHKHNWKQGVEETEATVREMRRKTTQIAPAYNKGALQYLPKGIETDEWPSREGSPKRK